MIIISQNSAKDELEIKTYANPRAGTGLAGGTLNAKDENENFDAEKFTKGFIYGLFGSKVTAERGSKLEQAEAKQEVVKGEGWTMRDGKPKPQNTEFRFSKEVRGKAKINDNPIVADLDMLQKKHSNVLKTKGAVARLILAIKDDPTHFLDGSNPQNALLLKKLKDGKTGMIGVRREDTPENLIVHALKSSNKKEIERLVRRQMGRASLPTTLKNETGTGAKAHSSASSGIIPQNAAKDELETLSKEYDVEQFLKDREDILAKDARYGKTRFSEARIEDNGGVGGWEYKRTPAGYDKNYNADFLITKADVAKIRGGKIDEQTLGKLKQDLESSEYLGYEYKKTHKNNGADEYADEEFFKGAPVESKGGHSAAAAIEEQRFANTGRDKNTIMYANPHVGAGLASGTLNAKDENGNFDAEKFAKGFIYGLFGSKVTAATLKKTNPKLYDQIVNIGKDKAGKESLSGRVDKIKMPNMGKFLQKLIADKNISDKTKTQMIEAAKGRYAQEIKNEQTKKAIEASAQKGRDMTPIGRDNLNAEIVEYLTNNRQNVAIDVLSPKIAQKLGFRYANVKRTISGDAVRHTINRHGKDSDLVKKSGQKPVAYDDIAKWAQYADEADVQAITKDNIKQDVLISGKQLSEHYYVVVESIRKKANELAFKTMYFEKGSLKNSEAFKDAQTLLRGYEPDANSFAPLKD